MVWIIKLEKKAKKDLRSLDSSVQKKILHYLHERIITDPRRVGKSLVGDRAGLWRYRVGDYRIICQLKDHNLVVLVIEVGHRKDVYD